MIKFFDTEDTISMSSIEAIEKKYTLNFPLEYKEHLLKYNGGRCEPNIFSFEENGHKTESRVNWFLAIYAGQYDNLEEYIKTYKIENKRLLM